MKPTKAPRTARLAYFVSHPIQYQAPLLRRIAQEPDVELQVFFSSDHSVGQFVDEGFGVKVEWDVPLLAGYQSEFLPKLERGESSTGDALGFARPFSYGIFDRIQRGGFDAVWVHGYSTVNALQAIFSASMLDVPVLLRAESTLHDRERSNAKMLAKEVFFHLLRRHVRGVLAIGKANAQYWHRYMGEDVPLYAMPYAVDNAFFERKASEAGPGTEALRRELGLETGRPVILFASKLQTRKRCGDLLEAWLRLREAGSSAYFVIIGDGEERATLEKQALGSPYSGDARFLGFKNQTELPAYFALCDVFVLPSIHEPWGLVVNEVMDASRAVIVSDDVGCQPDLVQNGVNGRVFPAGDVGALTESLADVLASPARAREMGSAGLEIVRQHSFEEDVAGLRKALADVVPGFDAVVDR
jgi:glycosyltransferase involved in cell wall biosynthesis